MEPDYDRLAERLEAAKEIAEPLRRRLWVVAVIAEALKDQGIRPIVRQSFTRERRAASRRLTVAGARPRAFRSFR